MGPKPFPPAHPQVLLAGVSTAVHPHHRPRQPAEHSHPLGSRLPFNRRQGRYLAAGPSIYLGFSNALIYVYVNMSMYRHTQGFE